MSLFKKKNYLFIWPHQNLIATRGLLLGTRALVPRPGTEPGPSARGAWNLSRWTPGKPLPGRSGAVAASLTTVWISHSFIPWPLFGNFGSDLWFGGINISYCLIISFAQCPNSGIAGLKGMGTWKDLTETNSLPEGLCLRPFHVPAWPYPLVQLPSVWGSFAGEGATVLLWRSWGTSPSLLL